MFVCTSNAMYVFWVITAYWVVSISMVYLNKLLLSNPEASITAPLFVTWYQCVITCVICYILGHIGERQRKAGETKTFFTDFPLVKYKLSSGASLLQPAIVLPCWLFAPNVQPAHLAVSH